MSLTQDLVPLRGFDGRSSERACGAALPTLMAGDGVQHSRETPEGAGVMELRFVLLYRGSEANVPGQSAHSAVGNKKGCRAVLFRAGGAHNAPTTWGEGRAAKAPEARSAAMVAPEQRVYS